MKKYTKEQLDKHLKTHSEASKQDKDAIITLEYFFKFEEKINTDFKCGDKWPNTDGIFELVPEPDVSREPAQKFIVQIKSTKSQYKLVDEGVKYQLKSLAFPAYIARGVTLDPGILFLVISDDTQSCERVFWKYMSPSYIASINFDKKSTNVLFSQADEIKKTKESVNEFVEKLVKISEKHSFMNNLENRDFSKEELIKVIEARSENICESIKLGKILNYTRDNISKRILTHLKDLCEAALMLNGLKFYRPVNLRIAWELALMDINTKFLATFLQGLRYIGIRVPDDGQNERLMLKYYDFLWKIRKFIKDEYRVDILSNLENFPINQNKEDIEYNKIVATAIDTVTNEFNPWKPSRYYVQKKTSFYIGTKRYFEITLQLADKYATKYNRLTVYTKFDISTNYSIQIGFEEAEILLWKEISSSIKVVTNWRVSIEPSILNKLSFILGKKTSMSSRYNEYDALMKFLTITGINLIDFIDMSPKRFNEAIDVIYKNVKTDYFKDILVTLREKFGVKSEEIGKNTIRYVILRLRENVIESVLPLDEDRKLNNESLNLSSRCYPFEKNPVLYNLPNHKTKSINKDIVRVVSSKKINNYLPYLRTKCFINSTGEMFFSKNQIEYKKANQTISNYNSMLSNWDKKQGMELKEYNEFVYIESYVNDTIRILRKLIHISKSGNFGQEQLNKLFLKNLEEKLIDESKIKAIKNVFVSSKLFMIYGAAGTGKTTLMDLISNLMFGRSKLFLTKTHTALDNLKRRIKLPGESSEFSVIDKIVRNGTYINHDLIFIDECSTIDNRTMEQLLDLLCEDSLLILAGDIYQIESIDFGNWFFYAKEIIPKKSFIELNGTWRTQDENIKTLWNEVRFKGPIITEKLAIDGPFSENITDNIFLNEDIDEVVLCLNYDGKFGLNSLNNYFQDANSSKKAYIWKEWKYKVGDPILFNDSKRFPMLYNNLKGRIVEITEGINFLNFIIDVDTQLTSLDIKNSDLELIDVFEKSSRISFSVYEDDEKVADDEKREMLRMKSIVPFQLAYAVSIHKAQGLEYNSIKIIIPNSNSELISHGIFYTAITRTKEKLKIFWSADTMKKVIDSFNIEQNKSYSLEFIKKQLGLLM